MYSYSLIQWMFLFYFYCFAGWCFESAYVSVKSRKLTNRGFLRGPFLPIYGSGAIMMLVLSIPFQENIILTYAAGCIGATVLEYVTGVAMEVLFQVRYWDYSENRFNFQGHVCLGSSLAWGFLTILMTEVIHIPVERFVLSIPGRILNGVTYLLTVVIFADLVLSFKAAVDLRNLLVKMEQAKEELVRIRRRLDVLIALADQEWTEYKAGLTESRSDMEKGRAETDEGMAMTMKEVAEGIESKLERLKHLLQARHTECPEGREEEILDLKTKYTLNMELRKGLSGLRDFFQRDMLRANPGMTSVRFKEALEELKQKAAGHRGSRKEK